MRLRLADWPAGRRDLADAFCYSNDGGLLWRLLGFFRGCGGRAAPDCKCCVSVRLFSLSLLLRFLRILLGGIALPYFMIYLFGFVRR